MIPGGTSTASKAARAMFGGRGGPRSMTWAGGCRVRDAEGREYLDTTMALGAVALGYAHPAVVAAVRNAAAAGVVGPLPPVHEARLAERLLDWVPGADAVRFLKTGAEAVAAAVRIARTVTGRERVVTCGYLGWLDWCQDAAGVPRTVRDLRTAVPFNDSTALDEAVQHGGPPAAIVVEPVVDDPPEEAWVRHLRSAADRAGAVLVLDEIKTGVRLGQAGAAGRWNVQPDLVILGKALGNGLPLAAVAGPRALMEAAERTWISSTLATEYVALAAAEAVLEMFEREDAAAAITSAGTRFRDGLERIAAGVPEVVTGVRGIPEMCYLTFRDDDTSAQVAAAAAARGLIFKRSAYNFMSLAHTDTDVDAALERLEHAVGEVAR